MIEIKIALVVMSIVILLISITVHGQSKLIRKLVEIMRAPCVEVKEDADEQR